MGIGANYPQKRHRVYHIISNHIWSAHVSSFLDSQGTRCTQNTVAPGHQKCQDLEVPGSPNGLPCPLGHALQIDITSKQMGQKLSFI